ncbi:MAG: GNAT family N-acetyltransferase [Candidatus Saccharimonadales bacterium]
MTYNSLTRPVSPSLGSEYTPNEMSQALDLINMGRQAIELTPLSSLEGLKLYTTQVEDRIIGAVALEKLPTADENGFTYHVLGIGVEEQFRGRGKGIELLERTLRDTARVNSNSPFCKVGLPAVPIAGKALAFLTDHGVHFSSANPVDKNAETDI